MSNATNAVVVSTSKAASKADRARVIFNDCYKDPKAIPARKDIIARMIKEAELTPAGAATYLQNIKREAGLVKAPAAAASAQA